MNLDELRLRYENHYAGAGRNLAGDAAAREVVGGDFDAVGALEFYFLKAHGLTSESFVVDIGCGTGRLAVQLSRRGHRHYAGFDIIGSAVEDARVRCNKEGWTFGCIDGLNIPLKDGVGDFVCFFSVFTHISHEHSYLYLKEAMRILRPGGVVLFTFLEFGIPTHWPLFEGAIRDFGKNAEPVVFMDRVGLSHFGKRLGFEVLGLVDGDKPTFPIEETIVSADGRVFKERGYLGQSLGIFRKPVL